MASEDRPIVIAMRTVAHVGRSDEPRAREREGQRKRAQYFVKSSTCHMGAIKSHLRCEKFKLRKAQYRNLVHAMVWRRRRLSTAIRTCTSTVPAILGQVRL